MADHVQVLTTLRDFYAGSVLNHKEAEALTAAISAMTVDEKMIARAEAYMLRVLPNKSTACLGGSFNFHDLLQAAIQGASYE